jgi:hypothetical protein
MKRIDRLAKEMRERFFAAGYAGRQHEDWETIGEHRREKWRVLVRLAEGLFKAQPAKAGKKGGERVEVETPIKWVGGQSYEGAELVARAAKAGKGKS